MMVSGAHNPRAKEANVRDPDEMILQAVVTVSIGRNVTAYGVTAPMPDLAWENFRGNVRKNLDLAFRAATDKAPYLDEKSGSAEYDGVVEESCTFVASGDDLNLLFLIAGLRTAAKAFSQKEIMFAYSDLARMLRPG
jgi:hypothetical protein